MLKLKSMRKIPFFFKIGYNEQMYVNKAICESFAAISTQMFARNTKTANRANVA